MDRFFFKTSVSIFIILPRDVGVPIPFWFCERGGEIRSAL